MTKFYIADIESGEGSEIEMDCATAEEVYASSELDEMVAGWYAGDMRKGGSSIAVDVRITRLAEGDSTDDEYADVIMVHALEPEEKHDWQSPHEIVGGLKENAGVHGSGGSVSITEVCALTGWYRITDHWDHQRNRPGTSISYREPDEASTEWTQGND